MKLYLSLLLTILLQVTTAHADENPAKKQVSPPVEKIAGDAELSKTIQQITSEYPKERFLNAVYQFNNGNEVIAKGANGFFSKETGKQLEAAQAMPIASVTKTMTAAGILRLRDKGLLDVNDTIAKHLTENSGFWDESRLNDKNSKDKKLPNWAHEVTIHNLLTHTSGLAEYFMAMPLNVEQEHKLINKDILNFAASKELLSEPGKEFKYTNTNYVILGLIIEHVSKQDLGEFYKQELFDPLDMKSTRLITLSEAVEGQIDQSKSGYPVRYFVTPNGADPVWTAAKPDYIMTPYADGGVLSTAEDVIKWHDALHNGKVLSEESYNMMKTRHYEAQNKTGLKNYAGYGLFISELASGDVVYHHAGSALAIRCESGYVPSKNLYFAVLSNVMNHIPENMKDKIDLADPNNHLDIHYFTQAVLNSDNKS